MDDVEKVKQKLDIVDIIQGYIPLKKLGRNFKANCPFHQEKSPSFTVSPERQIWHCFGCSKGGDVFTFVMEYENVDFGQALKILAGKAGIVLTKSVFRTEAEKQKDKIYKLNALAAQFYNYLLVSHPAGKKALLYLTEKRKTTPALIKTFSLGYAPTRSALSNYLLKKKGYKEFDLIEAGLATKRDGRIVDFFYDRIIFPISDPRGNIIAFSGRALNNEVMPKYVNTRETPVYVKGNTVFGLDIARDAIKKEGKVIIVEGEFDVISCFREGIPNTVAVKGTALTENQIKLLKRFAQKLVFCFDTDPAGTEAQRRSIELIEKEGISSSVIIPPLGKDPDELLSENPALFKKAAKEDINIYDFIIDSALKNGDKEGAEGKKKILEKTLPFLIPIENEVIKEHYFKKLATSLDTSLDSLQRQAEKVKRGEREIPKQEIQTVKLSRQELLEQYLLALILQSENIKKSILKAETVLSGTELSNPSYQRLFKKISEYVSSNVEFDIALFSKTLPPELTGICDVSFLFPIPKFETNDTYLQEIEKVARDTKQLAVKEKLQDISSIISQKEKDGKEEELEKLRIEYKNLSDQLT